MKTFFFFWRALAVVSLVLGLGLEHSCPWPRECLSSERLSLASDLFCVLGLGLEPCVIDSTSASYIRETLQVVLSRGGVEDTRLEAKAKDTKKNPRPRTAFPRTDTLEAKDRNARGQGQGPRTLAQVLSKKKKSSQKFFRRSPNKNKIFTKNFQAITTKKRFRKNFFKRSTKF